MASYLTDTLLVELNTTRVTAAQAKRRLQELRDHFDPSISLLSTERVGSDVVIACFMTMKCIRYTLSAL